MTFLQSHEIYAREDGRIHLRLDDRCKNTIMREDLGQKIKVYLPMHKIYGTIDQITKSGIILKNWSIKRRSLFEFDFLE